MKLGQMRCINSLIPENPINAEHPRRLEAPWPVRQLIQHLRTRGRGMRPQHQLTALLLRPRVPVPDTPEIALLVDLADPFKVVRVRRRGLCVGGGGEVECVLQVAGGMLLWDKEGIEVPEGGFDKGVCGHLFESHFEENVAEFFAHFH